MKKRTYNKIDKALAVAEKERHKGKYDTIGNQTKSWCKCGWIGKYWDSPFLSIEELFEHYRSVKKTTHEVEKMDDGEFRDWRYK